ncbi:MAG: hypothetical protein IID32_01055 [Planctomycetes bacterium]|nr:hypothetical protein [Planctomycetota bacterium]
MWKLVLKERNPWILPLLVILAGLFYLCFGHFLIGGFYHTGLFRQINESLDYQVKPIDHYFQLADKAFIAVAICFSVIFTLSRAVWSRTRIPLAWLIIVSLAGLASIYFLNPHCRVYGNHGFYRAGIVYQILNGTIPPLDPLFAGTVLNFPWGFPWLVAQFSAFLNITPFYASALINLIALALLIGLIFSISRMLIRDHQANIMSAICAIFAVTVFSQSLVQSVSRLIGFPIEHRVTPVFKKFSDFNGDPVGLVCFFLFVFSVIKLFESEKTARYALCCLAATLGCGFFYPPMLPGILASTLALCLVLPVLMKYSHFTTDFRKVILIASLGVLGLVLLAPYLNVLNEGVRQSIHLFDWHSILKNIPNYFFFTSPIIIIIALNAKQLRGHLQYRPLVILIVIAAATACSYINVHIVSDGEYKFFILSTISVGILGGIAFHCMKQWCNKIVYIGLFLLFLFPLFDEVRIKLNWLNHVPITYVERGRFIHSLDPEEDQLYTWIRDNTPIESAMIDTELAIPVYAQRCLFVAMDKKEKHLAIGYNIRTGVEKFLLLRHNRTFDEIEKRKRIVNKIFNRIDSNSDDELQVFFKAHPDVYIVVRKNDPGQDFNRQDFEQLFRSSGGRFAVYQPQLPSN